MTVDIINISDDFETIALRSSLEYWGVKVSLHLIGKAQDLVDVLDGQTPISPNIVLMCHGVDAGIVLPELAPSIAQQQPYKNFLTPANISQFIKLPDAIVINTGCATGNQAFAQAFLKNGATHYIAPGNYPDGNASLFFLLNFYYYHLAQSWPVETAYTKAHAADQDTNMFMHYS